jgi:signal transduction histidine kinase
VGLPPGKIWVEGDATRLEQVVVNLVNNAASFTPPGGNLTVAVTPGRGRVEIRVRDDGPGIPPDLLPHVFEPFVQGKQSAARSEGGLSSTPSSACTPARSTPTPTRTARGSPSQSGCR